MEAPYIKLAQSNLNPSILNEVVELVWNEVGDDTKNNIMTILECNDVEFE